MTLSKKYFFWNLVPLCGTKGLPESDLCGRIQSLNAVTASGTEYIKKEVRKWKFKYIFGKAPNSESLFCLFKKHWNLQLL